MSSISDWILRQGLRVLPASSADWGAAMRAECQALPQGAIRVRWALGCLWVCYTARLRSMNSHSSSPLGVSRWVFSLEMLLAFVPLTWLFLAVLVWGSRGAMPWPMTLLSASATVLGPLGLLLAARLLARPRSLPGRAMLLATCAAALWTVVAYALRLGSLQPAVTYWRELLLIAVLPALAAAHLWLIGARRRGAGLSPEMRG